MPPKSKAQANLMRGVANNPSFAKKVGIPQNVGREFMGKNTVDDRGLPNRVGRTGATGSPVGPEQPRRVPRGSGTDSPVRRR